MTGVERTAFETLLQRHERDVFSACRSILKDEHLALDAAQETFVRLWGRLARGAEPHACGAWLRRTAVSASIDLARRREVRARAASVHAVREEPSDDPSEAASRAELAAHLETALGDLTEIQRSVFVLRHFAGMKLTEVAGELALALPTVKTHFARACLKLQARLSRLPEDETREPR